MARICRGDESENPLMYSRTNLNRRRICYGKEKAYAENTAYRFGYVLELLVQRATNIDELTGAFLPTSRKMRGLYSVVLSNRTGSECRTRVTVGDLEPIWNQCFTMLLDEFTVSGFMDLELIDENHGEDPKTSQGRVVVGRARIRLPEDFGVAEARRAELVKEMGCGNKVVGYVFLKLRLSRIHARDIACMP
ncbi:hypothetical protein F511_25507 [Dorcoceras hygrometricum]|uniref:C2 domain-containing protein n=1 Tax=Dorcoceras hygrometricum TaxID=472368 RepID=A0A2Z7BL05_9LAMI|nr:hypothetical protein F511_04940 [Dorcoceras hygrometricum]KZV41684.1 hypothetical protein F511_25507 [Dorcoceras hygrometricum]